MDIQSIWNWTKEVQTAISIIGMVFSGYAACKLFQQNRRFKEAAKQAPEIENFLDRVEYNKDIQSSSPVALVIKVNDISPTIRPSVEQFLQYKGWSKKMPIEEINLGNINEPAADIEIFINELRQKRHLIDLHGYTEVHLFIMAPIMIGVLTGTMLDNWKPVKLYHQQRDSTQAPYVYWVPLVK